MNNLAVLLPTMSKKAKELQITNSQTKPKGVTTQMKALDEYILMVLFVLLLKRVHFL